MIPDAALAVLRASTIINCLPDRSGYLVALPDDGPGLGCPVCGGGAMGVCVVRQRAVDGLRLEAEVSCLRCAGGELAA